MQQIRQMIADVDKDGSGAIDYEEFEHMMTAKIGERDSKEELSKAFRIIDQDGNVKHHPSFLSHMLSSIVYWTTISLALTFQSCQLSFQVCQLSTSY